MARGVNNVFLIGRLTRDVELRSTTGGKSVASFSLAVDKASGDGADFFEIVAWEKLAELVNQYVGKGSKVCVQGRLQQDTWEQDGSKRSKVVINAFDVNFLDSKADSQANQTAPATTNTTKKDDVVDDIGDEPINLDDIPF